MNRITVFITTYNRPYFLLEAVKSVLSQKDVKVKVIVLDNHSNFGSLSIIKSKLPCGVDIISSSQNYGPSWNFTRAFKLAKSEYIMVLHDDDRLMKNMLREQLKILDSNPEIIALSCNGFFIDQAGNNLNSRVIKLNHKRKIYFRNSSQVASQFITNSCIPFSPTIYRFKNVKSIASNNQSVHSIYNQVSDVVLFMKLADIGPIVLNPSTLYECRIHDNQDSLVFNDNYLYKLRRYIAENSNGTKFEKEELQRKLKIYYSYNLCFYLFKNFIQFNFKNLKISFDVKFFTFKFIPYFVIFNFKKFFKLPMINN